MKPSVAVSAILVFVWGGLHAGVAGAAPLDDLERGRMAVNVLCYPGLRMTLHADVRFDTLDTTDDADGETPTVAWGFTAATGHRWALQARQFEPRTEDHVVFEIPQYYLLRTRQVDLVREVGRGVSVFAGWRHSQTGAGSPRFHGDGSPRDTLEVGAVGSRRLSRRTRMYASAAGGSGIADYEVGTAFMIARRLEFDVAYRYVRLADLDLYLSFADVTLEDTLTAKGLGFGVTYRF